MNPRVVRSSEVGQRERDTRGSEQCPTCKTRYSQLSERRLCILALFTPERPLLGIAELASDIGISRATTHRDALALRALGYLEQDPSHKYRLGLRVTGRGTPTLSWTELRERARPYLEELRHRTSYTTSIAVLNSAEIIYVDRARSFRRGQNKIDLNLRPGSRLPAYCTSMGKVLLASLPAPEQSELISEMTLASRGPNAITSNKALSVELERVLENGMAVNDEELVAGLVSMACPVRGDSGEVVAALNLAAHTSMISLEKMETQLLSHLLATANSISASLGYRRTDEGLVNKSQ